jgi:hypothetical protein
MLSVIAITCVPGESFVGRRGELTRLHALKEVRVWSMAVLTCARAVSRTGVFVGGALPRAIGLGQQR